MNQAILKENEFIIGMKNDDEVCAFYLRNPHIEPGNTGDGYDKFALVAVESMLLAAKQHIEDSYKTNQQ
jgi:hypothetical protein